jgi:hypothetical protein
MRDGAWRVVDREVPFVVANYLTERECMAGSVSSARRIVAKLRGDSAEEKTVSRR